MVYNVFIQVLLTTYIYTAGVLNCMPGNFNEFIPIGEKYLLYLLTALGVYGLREIVTKIMFT